MELRFPSDFATLPQKFNPFPLTSRQLPPEAWLLLRETEPLPQGKQWLPLAIIMFPLGLEPFPLLYDHLAAIQNAADCNGPPVGVLELIFALICLLGTRIIFQVGIVAWLATSFSIYRLGLFIGHYQKPCPCLGNLANVLHIPSQTADMAMKTILAYLLIGSYASLFWLWRQKRKKIIPVSSISTQ